MTNVPKIRDFTKRQMFAVLWDKATDTEALSAQAWLKVEAFPTLFPGHCFNCHMGEVESCSDPAHLGCPACWKEEIEKQKQGAVRCSHCEHSRTVHGSRGCHVTYPQECMCAGFNEPKQWPHGKFCVLCRSGEHERPPVEPCGHCGCARIHHTVNVGGERTGCLNHLGCDEWKDPMDQITEDRYNSYAPSDCMGGDCGCPQGAHE